MQSIEYFAFARSRYFYGGNRPWQTYWYPRNTRNEAMFEHDNYKTLCSAQKRKIAIMLSSGCDYCTNQLTTNKSNEYDPMLLPHLLLDVNKMGFESFASGGSFHFNRPLFCPRILISNQAKEKLNLANKELRRPDCPCQRENFKGLLLNSIHEEIAKKCNNGKCIFKKN